MTINSEKQRDYFFDNIKGFLIILVVFGHAIRYLAFKRNSTVLLGLFMLIYSFHMPLFIFISGFFSKKTNSSKLINLVFTYFLWQMIITPGFIAIFTNKTFIGYSKSFFEPYETYWYLVSLLIWRLITPYIVKIKKHILISFLLGSLIGFSSINLDFFAIGRTFAFYPFFLIGYHCRKEWISKLKASVNTYIAIGLILISSLGTTALIHFSKNILLKEKYLMKVLYMKDTYSSYLTTPEIGFILRIITYIIALILIISIIKLTPSKKTIFSKIGINSLFIYLSHGMILKALEINGIGDYSPTNGFFFAAITFIICFVYSYICTLKPIPQISKLLSSVPDKLFMEH